MTRGTSLDFGLCPISSIDASDRVSILDSETLISIGGANTSVNTDLCPLGGVLMIYEGLDLLERSSSIGESMLNGFTCSSASEQSMTKAS